MIFGNPNSDPTELQSIYEAMQAPNRFVPKLQKKKLKIPKNFYQMRKIY
jgi:hypothetical protein